ncbi:MAG: hypothetical protein M5U34_02370 [Chloroflexi bacterium]|nr:hypothetical protein [Chloroflexota bacterium]
MDFIGEVNGSLMWWMAPSILWRPFLALEVGTEIVQRGATVKFASNLVDQQNGSRKRARHPRHEHQ